MGIKMNFNHSPVCVFVLAWYKTKSECWNKGRLLLCSKASCLDTNNKKETSVEVR